MSFGGPDYTRVLDKALKNVVMLDPVSGLPWGTATNPLYTSQGAPTSATDVTATGALGALNNAVTISTKGLATVASEVDVGTLSGTVSYEATEDDTNWINVSGPQIVGGGLTAASDASFPARRVFPVGGYSQFRIRVSAYTSGTSNARLRGSVAPNVVRLLPSVMGSGTLADGTSNSGGQLLDLSGQQRPLAVYPFDYAGVSLWDRHRTPNTYKTAAATASGDTAVWTPASGKKFRIMRYLVELSNEAALAGAADLTVTLRDATTDLLLTHSFYVPAAGGVLVGRQSTPWIDLGNGKLSALANNVLNINLSAALTAGVLRVLAAGQEE